MMTLVAVSILPLIKILVDCFEVVKLVEKFFENNSYYRTFISSVHVFDFLEWL